MVDPRFGNFRHVEPHAQLFARAHLHVPGDVDVTLALFRIDRLRGRAERLARARFDLAQHEGIPLPRDDVRLAERRFIVQFYDAQPRFFQVFCRPLFSAFAESFFTNVLR